MEAHNILWADLFKQEAEILADIIGDNMVNINHIGSTSIPGIMAKPIIDILPEVKDIAKLDLLTSAMEQAGYEAHGEFGLIGRRYFTKTDLDGKRLVNVHCYQTGNPEIKGHLLFKEYMLEHPEEATEYSELKEKLAIQFPDDIDAYCNGKDLFVKNILAKAGFNELYLREVRTDNGWHHYHRIRKAEIFDRNSDLTYDYNHPSLSDPKCTHYVFYKGVDIIGVVFTEPLNDEDIVFRLLAIDKPYQNYGYGSIMLKQLENIVKVKNFKRILLHSHKNAYNFYRKNGYIEMEFIDKGKTFQNVIDMGKIL